MPGTICKIERYYDVTLCGSDMAKAVFDKLCERKSINDDYFYREVTYDYELLEDYQDLYTEFLQNGVTSNEKSSQQQVGKEKEKVEQFYNWGPKCYKYHTHPLYLMVRISLKRIHYIVQRM